MGRMHRRSFLAAVAAAGVGACVAAGPTPPPATAAEGDAPLRARAARKGLLYGAATKTRDLDDAAYGGAFAREAGLLVPEWQTKRSPIENRRGQLDFSTADHLSAFAAGHGMAFRGHTLVWHSSNPGWLTEALAQRPSERLLTDYVTAVAAHFRDRAHSWDVVNEAVEPRDGRPDGLRRSGWLEAYGPGYLDLAFHAAREGDSRALLVYNDYELEYAEPAPDARRRAVLRLLEGLIKRGTPVHALGLQSHLRAFGRRFDAATLGRFLAEVAGMGLKILVTELDVVDRGGTTDVPSRDSAVADMTARFLEVVLERPETVAVLTWGLSDRYTWHATREASRWPDGRPPRVLPLDENLGRKPMWHAMARAFDGAPAHTGG